MHFFNSILILVHLFAITQISQANRVTTYKELKIIDHPSTVVVTIDNPSNNRRIEQKKRDKNEAFLEDVNDYIVKLQDQAEEIRDIYNELIKSAFGQQLISNLTNQSNKAKDESIEVGAPRKPSADWVRATFNPLLLLNSTMQTNKSQNSTLE